MVVSLPGKKLLIVSDPLVSGSVQLNFLTNIIKNLGEKFSVTVYSSFVDKKSKESLTRANTVVKHRLFLFYKVYKLLFGNNEGVLWAYSWLMEFLFNRNSGDFKRFAKTFNYDSVINIAQTIPASSDIYWGQSVPLDQTLLGMRVSTPLLRMIPKKVIRQVGKIDRRFIKKIALMGKVVITNSFYTKTIYQDLGITVHGVIYSAPDLYAFRPTFTSGVDRYALAYIGKETEVDTIIEIARSGVKIVTFGSKIPTGSKIGELISLTEFRGYVSKEELIKLYSNAIFTVFPFTHEPFGYVPLESISCGTPVLTYSKQGPSETVIEGISGWLVGNRKDLVSKALEIWNTKQKMEISEDVQNAARNFARFGSYPEVSTLLISP